MYYDFKQQNQALQYGCQVSETLRLALQRFPYIHAQAIYYSNVTAGTRPEVTEVL